MINRSSSFQAITRSRPMKSKSKMEKTMGEFKAGSLHSGSKSGAAPKVKARKQAIAIGMNQARKAGETSRTRRGAASIPSDEHAMHAGSSDMKRLKKMKMPA
jgi:Family of unknown function (DUF6496)